MTKEGSQQCLAVLNRVGGTAGAASQGVDVGCRIVGQAIGLEVGPEVFDRVELGRIGWQVFEVGGTRRYTLIHEFALVSLEAVPDKDDGRAQLALQLFEEPHGTGGIDIGVGVQAEVERHTIARGRNAQGGDGRYLAMRPSPLAQHGCLAERTPGPAHQRCHQQARFVDKDDTGVQACGVFFTRGQSCWIQAWMRASSRSMARRVGFCGEKPKPCNRRLTCAG